MVLNNGFEQLKYSLPEEQKEWLLSLLKKTDPTTEIEILQIIESLGGVTKEKVASVLEDYDLPHYWYAEGFDHHEKDVLRELFMQLETDDKTLKLLDIGIGAGRASELAIEACKDLNHGSISADIHGVDLLPRFVQSSQEHLQPLGVSPKKIIQGDFLDVPDSIEKEKFHATWILMNTLFYCTTQSDLTAALKNVEQVLKEDGIFLFDTVKLQYHEGIPSQEIIRSFEDLKHFYTVLIRMYQETHPELPGAFRYPIYGNTTGNGFYSREVLSIEYIQYVLGTLGSNLHLKNNKPLEKKNAITDKSTLQTLGEGWIQDNEMKPWLRKEIAHRLQQMDRGASVVLPLYTFGNNFPAIDLDLQNPQIDSILSEIALEMAQNYTKQYYFFQKS